MLLAFNWARAFAAPLRLDVPLVLTQVPTSAFSFAARDRLPVDWFEGARVVLLTPNGQTRTLSTGFHSACDPDVSHDGKRILFAGKKDKDARWAVWEIGVEGGGLRVVTRERRDCRHPIYLGSLFTLDSPEPWLTVLFVGQEGAWDETGASAATSLYSARLDGTELRRLTFHPGASLDPIQTWDGRVLYAATSRPMGTGTQAGRVSLFGIHIDGMEQELYGAAQGQPFQRMPCATPGGWVVFVESAAGPWDGPGQLAGVREQRPHHSYRRVTHDEQVAWWYPSPWTQNTVLVSRLAAASGGASGVFLFDLDTGRAEAVFERAGVHALQAKAVRPRPMPDGRSTVVDLKYKTGKLYGLNCYTADPRLEPHLQPGSIQRLRVLEGVLPAAARPATRLPSNGTLLGRRLLGEAPVEPDGSFHIEIPADTPVQLQALDSQGLALATCGWTWVKQHENRGCIGCHEDPELMPENVFVAALGRKANALTLPPEKRRSVAFREHVAPLLRNKCAMADCHGGQDTPLSLALAAGQGEEAYAALLGRDVAGRAKYVQPGSARTSFLVWQVLGQDVSRPWDRAATGHGASARAIKKMPPDKAAPLSPEEVRLLIEWIDLGAQWETPKSPTEER